MKLDSGDRDVACTSPRCHTIGRAAIRAVPRSIDLAAAGSALRRRVPAAKSAGVRLVCFGDIHMAFRAIERLGTVLRDADCAILTGDLTHFGDPPDAFRVVNAVREHCPNVLAVTGNLDFV